VSQKFVVMGVSGCGKTTVGQALAEHCGLVFIDGDDLHPAQNIAKMSAGQALTDADRAPWLAEVGLKLGQSDQATVIGCSALKTSYRDIIRSKAGGEVHFLHLAAPKAVLQKRVAARKDHFMPPSLLDSQYDALEPLTQHEQGRAIDINQPLKAVITDCVVYVKETLA